MSQQYARIILGAFSSIRYTENALRFGSTIADVIATGDEIYPVIDALPNIGTEEAPSFRAPTTVEIANKVVAIADLAKPLYNRDLGVAGGIATLDEHGDVPQAQLPDEVVEYKGTWDPTTNTPTLVDGVGNIGDMYEVAEEVGNTDFEIDLGSGPVFVRGGMSIIFRAEVGDEANGRWAVQGSTGLSTEDRAILENSMQNVKTYNLGCSPAAPECTVGDAVVAQLHSDNNPYPEYILANDGGLSSISLNAMSGELYVDTAADEAKVYTVSVRVGGNLGQSEPQDIQITVNPVA